MSSSRSSFRDFFFRAKLPAMRMKPFLKLPALLLLTACAGSPIVTLPSGITELDNPWLASPELGELTAEADRIAADAGTAADFKMAFEAWSSAKTFPLVQGAYPGPADVTFVYYNTDPETTIALSGNLLGQPIPLKRWKNGPIWALALRCQAPESLEYRFVVLQNGQEVLRTADPLQALIRYEAAPSSLIRRPGTPAPAVHRILRLASTNPYAKIAARDVLIALPPGYFQNPETRYPVLYMHDGQQILDSPKAAYGGWKMDSIVAEMSARGEIRPPIVVGVYNSSKRSDELMGWSAAHRQDRAAQGALPADVENTAKAYDHFLVNEIKPLVDRLFRTLPDRGNTAIGGSSSGAMEALYQIFIHPDVFSGAAALSGGEEYYRDLMRDYFPGRTDLKIYMDCGDQGLDARLLTATLEMDAFLRQKGYVQGSGYDYWTVVAGEHNEANWASRVPRFLKLLFAPE